MDQAIKETIPYIFNFTVVVATVAMLARNPLKKYVYQRHEHIKDAVESAQKAFESAKNRRALAERAKNDLLSDAQSRLEAERRSGASQKATLIEQARADAKQVARDGERISALEEEAVVEGAKKIFLKRLIEESERRIKSDLKGSDHAEIINRVRSSLEVGAR